jgi:cytoskeletal protein CcmA (bactofilin family)
MKRRIALLLGLALAGSAAAEDRVIDRMWIGGDVIVSQTVEGPVFAMGGNVALKAPIDGAVHVAGGDVELGPDAAIMGDVSIAGGNVVVQGPILGDLRAAGGDVRLDGQVTGDASIAAGTLELGPHARIEGRLAFYGRELHRDPAAQVLGGVERRHGHRHEHAPMAAGGLPYGSIYGWIWTAALLMLAALIAGALPEASKRMALELRERPWLTPLLGLLALASIPVAALLLVFTIIGIPVAVLALIGYVALLLVAYVWVAVVVGAMLLDRVSPESAARTASRVGAAVLAMLVLAILVRVPVVGGFVKLAALAVGVGMIVATVFRRSPARPAPGASAAA